MADENTGTEETQSPQEFICIDRLPPLNKSLKAVQDALNENPSNGVHSTGPFGGTTKGLPASLVVNVSKFWAPGRTLKVKFLSGSKTLRDKVIKHARTWEQYANLTFDFVADNFDGKTEIRVNFDEGDGHWSYLGTDNLGIPQNEKTMNLDVKRAGNTEIQRVALHEFGHAIGCEHEHQSPFATFVWDKEVVYRELADPPNEWPREVVDHNVLNRLLPEEVVGTEFDATSIMCYSFPKTWFKPGTGAATNNNTRLSQRDMDFIATIYPADYSDVGVFNTMQVRAWDKQGNGRDTTTAAFTPVYPEPPRLALGLTWLDLDAAADLSVQAVAEGVERDHFTVGIVSKPPARLFSAATAWLEVAARETDIVIGSVDFSSPGEQTIKFPRRFDDDAPPTVVAWLTGFELGKDGPWKIQTRASDASPFNFKLSLEAGAGVDLRRVNVSYAAFPAGKEGILGGVFSTDDVPGLLNTGTVNFLGEDEFARAPELFTAISGLDFDNGHNLRLRLSTSVVSAEGFSWNFDSWYDSLLNSATAAYIAILPVQPNKTEVS